MKKIKGCAKKGEGKVGEEVGVFVVVRDRVGARGRGRGC